MNIFSKRKLYSLIAVTAGGYCTYAGIRLYKGEEKFYSNYVMPLVHLLEPETAHNLAVLVAKYGFFPRNKFKDPPLLKVELFGKEFPNPIGIAAGFDKDGKAIIGLTDIGFGFVEVGTVTPEPQPGNDKPRVFRLSNDLGVINRYGFNSEGHDAVFERINNLRQKNFQGIIGVNLGKNKTSPDAISDYVKGIQKFGPVADYLVINVSSPNTPGLRNLQHTQDLKKLLSTAIEARNGLQLKQKPPLLLKVAPDLNEQEVKDIANVVNCECCRVDGLIVSNTTIARPEFLTSSNKMETGGLSGKPLKETSTRLIKHFYKLTNGMPIIGVGGISSGQDAYEKIKAGATLVQIYTAMTFDGPPVLTKIKRELFELMKNDGLKSIKDAVGRCKT